MEDFRIETRELIAQAWQVRWENFGPEIFFDYPAKTQSISLTGKACALQCAHCGGHYLESMLPIEDIPAGGQAEVSFTSALISGGCTVDGKVPFFQHLNFLRELKEKKEIRLNCQTGLLAVEEIALLSGVADIVSFDFIADQDTITEVYGLQRTPEDYRRTYEALRKVVPVMPHLTIGLKGGLWGGEEQALEMLAELGLDGLTFLVFIPTPGTRYAGQRPPEIEEVVRFLAKARLKFTNIPLALGCMRPRGRYRQQLDEVAVALGLNRIVMPAPAARALASQLRLEVRRGEECCAL